MNIINEEKPSKREYSILGGGDIGFPVLLVSSVYFAMVLVARRLLLFYSFLVSLALTGYRRSFLREKPCLALPPIAVMSVIGLGLVSLIH